MRLTIVHEPLGPGVCSQCGQAREALFAQYFEAGEHRGRTAPLCPDCYLKEGSSSLILDPPPEDKGPRPPSRSLRKRVQKQERQLAESIGGRTQKASGALASHKGDVRKAGVLRGEAKATTKKSFSLTRDILDKIRSECVGTERPFVHLKFLNPHTLAIEDDWIIIPLEDWARNQCR